MRDFAGKVAVITGAAGGLGKSLARRFARAGMKLALADLDADVLAGVVTELDDAGAVAIGVRADVRKAVDVEALAARTLEKFGAVHVVCNNAGVAPLGAAWESTAADWEWVLGVNLWGAIHGVRVFTPIMLEQGGEGHIVNTASVAGLIAPPGMAAYNVSKHAVVALTESLHHDLVARGAKVRCSVVCPAYFPSGIAESERVRPTELAEPGRSKTDAQRALEDNLRKAVMAGKLSADAVAARVFDAVRDERFYVLTHPRIKPAIEWRMRDILEERTPIDPMRGPQAGQRTD
ncbi:MAG: SDR family NAD(P)-dependent oxidoreductase [Betaproteobacteria bacterium]|jgi:NAD(P)-dependent dehydrogenase (short-subunit alcohol dehydrogenase family)|nr:SDR family NAD(P)-dependent oxidoreductase [Betaproteobacteria bacterium]